MRVALAIAMATFTLGLTSQPMHGQMRTDVSPLKSIQMIDALIGWAATRQCGPCPSQHISGAMLRTVKGGTQWNDVTPLDSSGQRITVVSFHALNALVAWATGAATGAPTAQVFRTVDGGRRWRSASIPAPPGFSAAPNVKSISFINPREGWLIASLVAYMGNEEVEIYRSTDGGETWIKVASATRGDDRSGLPIDGPKIAISFLNPTTGWIPGYGALAPDRLYLHVTHDGGRTWRQQNMPLPRELTPHWEGFPQPPKFFTARDGILPVFYALLDDSFHQTGMAVVFYATHDSGTTWAHTAPVPVSASEVVHQAVGDMNHAWVTSGGVLHATNDSGRRWTTLRPNRLFADVKQLDFISSQVGWAVRQTFPFLLKTLDGGRTWTAVNYTILRR